MWSTVFHINCASVLSLVVSVCAQIAFVHRFGPSAETDFIFSGLAASGFITFLLSESLPVSLSARVSWGEIADRDAWRIVFGLSWITTAVGCIVALFAWGEHQFSLEW